MRGATQDPKTASSQTRPHAQHARHNTADGVPQTAAAAGLQPAAALNPQQPRGRHKVQRGRSADAAKEDDQLVALAPAQGAVGAAKDEGAVANAGTAAARRQDGGIDIEHHRF